MNIRGFNAIDYTSNANNINFKVLDNIESKVQLLPLNSSKATEDIDFTGDFDPDPKAITYANEIMNAAITI